MFVSFSLLCRVHVLALLACVLVSLAACGSERQPAPDDIVRTDSGREVRYWYDPMHPAVQFDKPGRSPFMDMALVPMYADEADETGGIVVTSSVTQSLGVRVATVGRDTVRPQLRTTAMVRADQDNRFMLVSRAAGWIEHLDVHAVGDTVRAGQVLAEIYSPELVQAQEELLLLPANAEAATERLQRLGIADTDIAALRDAGQSRRRLPLRAPITGTVANIRVHHGSRVTVDQPLLEIVPDDRVWIDARLFPGQAAWLGLPVEAHFRLPGDRGQAWRSSAGYLDPNADPVTQTQSLRFVLDASTRSLPPGTWLDAELRGAVREGVLLAPAESVIRTGSGDHVVVVRPDKRFAPIDVHLGSRYGDRFEVLHGLVEGDEIVVSGQFLLDSEAELRSGMQRLRGSGDGEGAMEPAQQPAHRHAH